MGSILKRSLLFGALGMGSDVVGGPVGTFGGEEVIQLFVEFEEEIGDFLDPEHAIDDGFVTVVGFFHGETDFGDRGETDF